MATIEPLVKRLKKSKKKKIKFEIPEEDNESENKVSEENKPLINVSEFENNSNTNGINWLSHWLDFDLFSIIKVLIMKIILNQLSIQLLTRFHTF